PTVQQFLAVLCIQCFPSHGTESTELAETTEPADQPMLAVGDPPVPLFSVVSVHSVLGAATADKQPDGVCFVRPLSVLFARPCPLTPLLQSHGVSSTAMPIAWNPLST